MHVWNPMIERRAGARSEQAVRQAHHIGPCGGVLEEARPDIGFVQNGVPE